MKIDFNQVITLEEARSSIESVKNNEELLISAKGWEKLSPLLNKCFKVFENNETVTLMMLWREVYWEIIIKVTLNPMHFQLPLVERERIILMMEEWIRKINKKENNNE